MTASFTFSKGKVRAFCGLTACCLLLLYQPARAQRGETRAQGNSLNDLKAALLFVGWNSRTHGPLIAIAPEKVLWDSTRMAQRADATDDAPPDDPAALQPLGTPAENDTLDADTVARHFRRKLIRLPTLSIFAPPKMTVLHTHLQPANPFLVAQTDGNMQRLEATLTPAQWQMLGSPTGLGREDVTKEQQPLFDAVLPKTMTVIGPMSGVLGRQTSTVARLGGTLTLEQRQQVRLHLERREQIDLVDEKNQILPIGSTFHSGKVNLNIANWGDDFNRQGRLFGQAISEEIPNRLKPSDLDLKQALLQDTYVPLTGVKTVGDLLQAASKATGLELRADDRLARLTVYLSTEDRLVHASDLLEGLCWSLTATYREVGPVPGGDQKDFAYVLTYDRAGMAALRGVIADWHRRGEALRGEKSDQFDAAISKMNPRQYIHYAENDSLNPTNEALSALHEAQEDQADSGDYSGQVTVPVSVLTPEQRQQMKEGLRVVDQHNQDNLNFGNNTPPSTARTDRVKMSDSVVVAYIVPGVGEVSSDSSWSVPAFALEFPPDDAARRAVRAANRLKRPAPTVKPTIEWKGGPPVALGQIIVCFAPATIKEAESMFDATLSLHVSEVWITTPGIDNTDAGRKLLAACAQAGAAHGVKVGAQVSLVRMPLSDAGRDTAALDTGSEDRNVFGETGAQWAAHFLRSIEGIDTRRIYMPGNYSDGRDLLAAEAPATRTLLGHRLRAIAAVPGLTTLVLRDVAAPGRDWFRETHDNNYNSWIGSDFGFTVADRLAFLRQSGYDPIDIPNPSLEYQVADATKLPRFDIDSDEIVRSRSGYSPEIETNQASQDWSDYRSRTERDLLHDVRADLRETHPDTALYLASYAIDNVRYADGRYQLWSDSDAIPFGSAIPAPRAAASAVTAPASARKPDAALRYFPFGRDFAAMIQKGYLSPTAAPTDFGYAATYIRNRLQGSARQPAPSAPSVLSAPPGVILDMSGLKTADALTLLRGTLEALRGKK